jgi:hypothetical protein
MVLGTKARVDLAVWPSDRTEEVVGLLTRLLAVPFEPIADFLCLTLAGKGQIIHPGVMYGLFRDWDGKPFEIAPKFYQSVDDENAQLLQRLSAEVLTVRDVIERGYPNLDLSSVLSLHDWLRRAYGHDIEDDSTLVSSFRTNRSYDGIRAPVRLANGKIKPDFQSRYLAEDVPYDLVVTRGIAELAGVETPNMDQVIYWAQAHLNKVYLVKGELSGPDVRSTRAPQRYGYRNLEGLLRHYLSLG